MVRALKILVVAVFFMVACAPEEQIPEPEGLLSQEQMVEVMTDIHLIEGARTGLVIMGDTVGGVNEHYKAFFEKHHVSQNQFDSSFVYYSKKPEVFDKIYERVIENLSVIESEIQVD